MAAADFSLRVATDPDGRLTELCLSSPTGSSRRSLQPPLRPALKPAVAPLPKRVQWAARNQVHTFTSGEAEGQEEDREGEPQEAAARHSGRSSSGSRQHHTMQPGSPGWHSPPTAGAAANGGWHQSAAYSAPAVQPQAQPPYWDAASAAAAYYQHYGWAYQHPAVPGQQQPVAQPQEVQPAVQTQEVQQQPQAQAQDQQQQPQQDLPCSVGQGSMLERGASAPGSPTHLQVQAGSVYITIDSPELKLQGIRAPADSSAAAATGTAAAATQQAPPAKPAACSAGTQTEPSTAEPPAAAAPAGRLAPQPQAAAPLQPQQPPVVQQLQAELPPGIPAGPPPQLPWPLEQRQEGQRQEQRGAAAMPPLRLPPCSSAAACSAQLAAQQREAEPAGPAWDGDVSSWGRLQAGESYWEGEGLTTGGSLSSGLSPRESRPRQREWDHAEAAERLAAQATAYGHAMRQQLRGRGTLSATDALPARLAAQQLASLAGMSRKVQEALLHSQAVFQRQASVVEQAVLARAFWAWRHLHSSQQQRRAAVLAARRRIETGQLRRCLHAWRSQCGRHEARAAVLLRAAAQLRRGLLKRCWQEWRRLVGLRAWKVQVEVRDQQIHLMGQQLRHLESRPVRYMARRRMRALLYAWQAEAHHRCAKRQGWQAAQQRSRHSALAAALGGWLAVAAEAAARRRALQRSARLLGRLRLRHMLAAWRAAVEHEATWRKQVAEAKQLRRRQLAQRAFRGWRFIAWFKRTAAATQRQRQAATLAAALGAWRRHSAAKAATAALLAELRQARAARLAGLAFGAWAAFVEGRQARQRDEELGRLAEAVQRLSAENEQLTRENERLARVIDSGDWSRQRVQELLEAGRVLQAERDALQKLVGAAAASGAGAGSAGWGGSCGAGTAGAGVPPLGNATNSPEAVPTMARSPSLAGSRDCEGGLLQWYHVSAGSIQPDARGGSAISAAWGGGAGGGRQAGVSSRPTSPAARNKLLVKSGSSFNAMVRALKQDLVTSGALARGTGPAALYEVNKLSLNRLTVAADGAVEVEAVSSPDRRGVAFGSIYPPSPKRQLLGPAVAPRDPAGQPAAGLQPASGGTAAAEAAATMAGRGSMGQGGSSSLLAAAMRLQGIGGRSVGLRGSRG